MSHDQTSPDPWQPTESTTPTPDQAAVVPAPATAPPPVAPSGSSRSRWMWAAGTVAAALFAGMVGGGLVALVAGHDDVHSLAGTGRLDDRGGPGDGDRGHGNGGH